MEEVYLTLSVPVGCSRPHANICIDGNTHINVSIFRKAGYSYA